MKLRKRTVFFALLILLIGLGIFSAYSASRAPKKVTIESIKKGNLQVVVSASGKVQSVATAELSFTSTGRISYLPFKEGDRVKKGQVLAYLDGTAAKEQSNKAWADYRLALEKLREFENNNKDKPKDDKYSISKAQLEAQRDASSALVAQSLTTFSDKTLISPIDGVIATITADVGETPGTQPVITIVNDASLEFVAEVDEQDIGTVSTGLTADIFLDAYKGAIMKGTVTKIESVAKTGTTGNTYYPVRIAVDPGSAQLLIGMSGDVDITTKEKTNVTLVPLEVLIDEENKRYVFTVINNKAVKREITTGLESENDAEVISGLTEGESVITGDTSQLTDNAEVSITK